MKILFLTHSFPYPPNEGIKLMSYNLLKELSKRHTVTLLSLIESEEEKKYIPQVEKFCQQIETIVHKVSKSPFRRFWNIFFQKKPFCVYQFYSRSFLKKLKRIISEEKFDILHFDFVNTSFYCNFVSGIPTVFFPHDAMSMLFFRNIGKEKNFFRQFYTYAQWKKMVRYEREIIPKFGKTAVVSLIDKEWLCNSLGSNFDISIIPNGVDSEYFKPLQIEEDFPSVIFRGIMNFFPNVEAAIYFAKKILPLIRKEIPNTKYYVIGKNPTREVKQLALDPLNIVTGYVEDIRPYVAKSTVNVCPMRIGSGIKNKILEAMAMTKPTVATSLACEGIPEATDGGNILIADTPEEFAEKVILLLKNEILRKKIGKNGRKFVLEKYTWQGAAEKFEKLYEEAIGLRKIKKISLIVPIYNEGETIKNVLKKLSALNFNKMEKEIIVVNDGSTDRTREILERLQVAGYKLQVVHHKENQGKGAAVRTGLKEVTGEVIVIQDADLEYNPEELEKLFLPITQNNAKIVYGSRFLRKNPTLYLHYYWGNKLLSFLISFLYGQKVTDAYTCYKMLQKNVLKNISLKSKRFEFEAEITCKLLKEGYKIHEIPISYQPRSIKEGKKIRFNDAIIGIWTILKVKF